MPALGSSAASPIYSEIELPPESPTTGIPRSPRTPAYEYADPLASGKWSLQHIARGEQVECEYATIPAEYSDGTYTATDVYPGLGFSGFLWVFF